MELAIDTQCASVSVPSASNNGPMLRYEEIVVKNHEDCCCYCNTIKVSSDDSSTGKFYASPIGHIFKGHGKVESTKNAVVFAICAVCLDNAE